jgi:hypothetical protein
VAAELITWVKGRVTLMGLTPDMWHEESSAKIISDFLSSKQNNRLIIFIVRLAPLLIMHVACINCHFHSLAAFVIFDLRFAGRKAIALFSIRRERRNAKGSRGAVLSQGGR